MSPQIKSLHLPLKSSIKYQVTIYWSQDWTVNIRLSKILFIGQHCYRDIHIQLPWFSLFICRRYEFSSLLFNSLPGFRCSVFYRLLIVNTQHFERWCNLETGEKENQQTKYESVSQSVPSLAVIRVLFCTHTIRLSSTKWTTNQGQDDF